jgi:hypothetical protein
VVRRLQLEMTATVILIDPQLQKYSIISYPLAIQILNPTRVHKWKKKNATSSKNSSSQRSEVDGCCFSKRTKLCFWTTSLFQVFQNLKKMHGGPWWHDLSSFCKKGPVKNIQKTQRSKCHTFVYRGWVAHHTRTNVSLSTVRVILHRRTKIESTA